MSGTIFMYKETSIYSQLDRLTSSVQFANKLVMKLAAHAFYRRNPRTWEYMKSATAEVFEEFADNNLIDPDLISGVDWKLINRVVLIWQDANGLGWAHIEARVLRNIAPGTSVVVINGRRRVFDLKEYRKRLLLRRFLEKTFATDIIASVAYFAFTPILLVTDLIRQKK